MMRPWLTAQDCPQEMLSDYFGKFGALALPPRPSFVHLSSKSLFYECKDIIYTIYKLYPRPRWR